MSEVDRIRSWIWKAGLDLEESLLHELLLFEYLSRLGRYVVTGDDDRRDDKPERWELSLGPSPHRGPWRVLASPLNCSQRLLRMRRAPQVSYFLPGVSSHVELSCVRYQSGQNQNMSQPGRTFSPISSVVDVYTSNEVLMLLSNPYFSAELYFISPHFRFPVPHCVPRPFAGTIFP